jgi:hypothetical protein
VPDSALSIECIDDLGNQKEEFLYQLKAGVVRRIDLDPPEGDTYLDDESYEAAKAAALASTEESDAGQELEEALGLYDAPIDTAELEGLSDLLLTGEFTLAPEEYK